MKIVLAGSYGVGNAGDDLLMEAFRRRFTDAGVEVVVACGPMTEPPAEHVSLSRRRIAEALEHADALVFGGGGLFNDAWSDQYLRYFASLATWARLRRKRVAGIAVGVEPPATARGRMLLRVLGRAGTFWIPRDERSLETARSHGWRAQQWLADPVSELFAGYPAGGSQPGGPVVVALSARHTDIDGLDAIAQGIPEGTRVTLLVMQRHETDPLEDDRSVTTVLEKKLADRGIEASVVEPSGAAAIAGAFSGASAAIGNRMHALIPAARMGVRVVAIRGLGKVESFARGVGAEIVNPSELGSALVKAPPEGSIARVVAAMQEREARFDLAFPGIVEALGRR